jgi:hypothetical protein
MQHPQKPRHLKGSGLPILYCTECGAARRADFLFVCRDGFLRCIPCSGKKINLLHSRLDRPKP